MKLGPGKLVSLAEAASTLSRSLHTLRRWARAGRITVARQVQAGTRGGNWTQLFRLSELMRVDRESPRRSRARRNAA